MDPISVTASIITLFQAANAVLAVCYNYQSFSGGSSSGLSTLIIEVRSLRDVLESVVRLVSDENKGKVTDRLPTLRILCQPSGPLATGLEKLETLERRLTPSNYHQNVDGARPFSRRHKLWQALSWPLKEAESQKLIEEIAVLRSTLSLAMETDQTGLLLAMQDLATQNHDLLVGTQESLENLQRASFATRNDYRRQIFQSWLAAPDSSTSHAIARSKKYAGTGEWLLSSKEFQAWKDDFSLGLWICGIPGCGKTTLSSTIIDHLQERCYIDGNSRKALTYFYFDFNDAKRQSADDMMRGIISQFVSQTNEISAFVDALFASKSGQLATFDELVQLLQQLVSAFDDVFLVLDALDECENKDRLWKALQRINANNGRLHLLITSRSNDEAEMGFNRLKLGTKIILHGTNVDNDIRSYVQERLRSDPKLRRWQRRPDLVDDIKEAMMTNAQGMFRWVACQLDALERCLNASMLRQALLNLPKSLDDMYTKALCGIQNEHSELVSMALKWLTYSTRPLAVEELAEIATVDLLSQTTFDPDRRLLDPRDILDLLPSIFVSTTYLKLDLTTLRDKENTGNQQVRLAHFSVKQYLTSAGIQSGPASQYAVTEAKAHACIAQVCIAYLLQFNQPYPAMADVIQASPLLRYAANYWSLHARLALANINPDAEEKLCSIVMELFTSDIAYLNWSAFLDGYTPFNRYPGDNDNDAFNRAPHPLYYASSFGLINIARQLLDLTPTPDINSNGQVGTALAAACLSGHLETARLLLDNGADIEAEGLLGTPILLAAGIGHMELVKLLIDRGADATGALEEAKTAGHQDVVRLLSPIG
ncbi:uncharacterized protein BDV14DRAFT_203609 [Aspergillus stella-maris]|uniref:uncharacterized protein n=1 Tax=Aspergillus stella-maris TaxID=1810926 RepID=UPI003CCCCC84